MKKCILIILAIYIFSGCTTLQTIQLTESSKVVEVKGKSADELYEAIRFYVSEHWNNPKHVTKYEEKSQNKISISGEIYRESKSAGLGAHFENTIRGSLVFYIKNERFKIVAKNLTTEQVGINAYGDVTMRESAPGIMPEQKNILETYARDIKHLINSETNEMDF